jgi:hypothetical protein
MGASKNAFIVVMERVQMGIAITIATRTTEMDTEAGVEVVKVDVVVVAALEVDGRTEADIGNTAVVLDDRPVKSNINSKADGKIYIYRGGHGRSTFGKQRSQCNYLRGSI